MCLKMPTRTVLGSTLKMLAKIKPVKDVQTKEPAQVVSFKLIQP